MPAAGDLPEISNLKPTEIQLQANPLFRKQPQTLMRQIDLENRFRYFPSRQDLFFGQRLIKPGCILLVDQITSRLNPQVKYFAGVVLGIRESGITSRIVLRGLVMGVGVEMTFPIFSPMISKFTVLQEPPEKLLGQVACYWIRDKPRECGIDFGAIEFMVMKHKNQQLRAKQLVAEKAAMVKEKMETLRKSKAQKALKQSQKLQKRTGVADRKE
jgi:ribosomal protein L19